MGESDSDGLSEDGEDGDSEDSDDDVIHANKDVLEVGEMPRTDKQIRKERRRNWQSGIKGVKRSVEKKVKMNLTRYH